MSDVGTWGGRRVLVVDDHTYFRDGLVGLLVDSGVDVVADVPTGEASLDAAARYSPEVVVMDLSMPGMGGVEATRRLIDADPECRVLMLTVSHEEEDILNAILAGAIGFVLKDGPIEDVVTGIERAASGVPFFSARVAPQLLRHVRHTSGHASPLNRLSEPEMEVLTRLADGHPLARIAQDLDQPERAVRRHCASIVLKLQAESRGETAVRALRDRIV